MKNPNTNQGLTTTEEKVEFLKNAENLQEIYNSQITKKELDDLEDRLPTMLYVMTDVIIENYILKFANNSLSLFKMLKETGFDPFKTTSGSFKDLRNNKIYHYFPVKLWAANLNIAPHDNIFYSYLKHPKTLKSYPDLLTRELLFSDGKTNCALNDIKNETFFILLSSKNIVANTADSLKMVFFTLLREKEDLIDLALNTEFGNPVDFEAILKKIDGLPKLAFPKKDDYKTKAQKSLNARKLYQGQDIKENKIDGNDMSKLIELKEFSVEYFKSLVEVRSFDSDLQNRINHLAETFPKDEQLQEAKVFLEEFKKTKVAGFEDNFTLLIPHLPNVTPDFIETNTKDQNGQNGIRKFPEGFSAPAYAFREGGQASNFGDDTLKRFFALRVVVENKQGKVIKNLVKRFFALRVVVENEQGKVIKNLDNSPLNLISELLEDKNGVKKLEKAFLKCQINQLFEMQIFIEKDFKYLPLEKNLKEKFLTAFESVQEKISQAQEENEQLRFQLKELDFSRENETDLSTHQKLLEENIILTKQPKKPGLSPSNAKAQTPKEKGRELPE